ncbi:hypothetical protein BP6252_07148 [Coleophoma cylindrospora]|uniref:Uncharacterized protein n=1 Tax=Coleophoma cylindrospora TaxID=1849047 RepID=A0A3D8RHB1_9HELO|nr:hypothetical protein BP6252_07148 [Coleophoma cylindrospora]
MVRMDHRFGSAHLPFCNQPIEFTDAPSSERTEKNPTLSTARPAHDIVCEAGRAILAGSISCALSIIKAGARKDGTWATPFEVVPGHVVGTSRSAWEVPMDVAADNASNE